VVLPLAGYLVQPGDFTFAGALVASTACGSARRRSSSKASTTTSRSRTRPVDVAAIDGDGVWVPAGRADEAGCSATTLLDREFVHGGCQ
jgi:hypothetical protein